MAHDIARAALRVWRGREGPDELTVEERREVGAAVRQLRAGLVGERALVGARYLDDPALRTAYLLYHVPLNAARMASVLPELGLDGEGPLRVLDIGAGPGSLGLAAALGARRAGRDIRVFSTDRSTPALGLGAQLAAQLGLEAAWRSLVWRLPDEAPAALREERYDLISLGNVLNELWSDQSDAVERRADWILRLARTRLGPGGRVVLLEPALRETGRALLELRSLLVEGGLFVHAPLPVPGALPGAGAPPRLVPSGPPVGRPSARRGPLRGGERGQRAAQLRLPRPRRRAAQTRNRPAPLPRRERADDREGKAGAVGLRASREAQTRSPEPPGERGERRLLPAWTAGDLVRIDGLAEKGDGLRVGEETGVCRVFSAILPS